MYLFGYNKSSKRCNIVYTSLYIIKIFKILLIMKYVYASLILPVVCKFAILNFESGVLCVYWLLRVYVSIM